MAIMLNAAAKQMRASISGTTALKSAPKNTSFSKPALAQPWRVIMAMNCIHLGRTKRGHQQPPETRGLC